MAGVATLPSLLATVQAQAHRPRLIWYADAGRTELSGASLVNWTAKISGLLTDEIGLGPGDRALITATTSWQLVPTVLGCWFAGLSVTTDAAAPAAVGFRSAGEALISADEVFVLTDHPLGLSAGDDVGGADLTSAVLPHSDRLGAPAVGPQTIAFADVMDKPLTALLAEAHDRAAELAQSAPVVLWAPEVPTLQPLASAMLTALALDGCLVCVTQRGADGGRLGSDELARITDIEHVTATV